MMMRMINSRRNRSAQLTVLEADPLPPPPPPAFRTGLQSERQRKLGQVVAPQLFL